MKKYIVITSIFEPTEAVMAFATMNDYRLIVVGDIKSPSGWQCDNALFLSVDDQKASGYTLAEILPYNHYCRKMIGYLAAMENGAGYIVDTDDDNIPKAGWCFPPFEGKFDCIGGGHGFVNIYRYYTGQHIWPRGLPLHRITEHLDVYGSINESNEKIGVWQGLADEDPDVDAIYRLTSDAPCYFAERPPLVLGQGTVTPFNTQNTIIRKELFPLMYLPTYVTFRFTDILRGLIAQPIMWLYGYRLGFINATVVQKRNPHDYMKDFNSEIPMYQNCERVIDLVTGAISADNDIETNLHRAYCSLLAGSVVVDDEMKTLEAWLKDVSRFV
jgi:hypothetical protein